MQRFVSAIRIMLCNRSSNMRRGFDRVIGEWMFVNS